MQSAIDAFEKANSVPQIHNPGNGEEKELLETTILSLESWHDQRWISVPKCMRYVLDNALKLLKEQKWYGEHCGDCEDT